MVSMEDMINKFRYPLVFTLGGLLLIGVSILYLNKDKFDSSSKIEIIDDSSEENINQNEIVIEVSGGIEKPGVYKLSVGSRIEDALILAGGMSENADRNWVEKSLNRAAKLTDGLKIYIPTINDSTKQTNTISANSDGGDQNVSPQILAEKSPLVNINNASLKELDTLPGIGPVYAQNIIEQRPYSNIEELISKGALKQNVYEKIKNLVSVY